MAELNSYVSLEDAGTYFASRLYSSAWTAASTSDKESALVQATRMLDENMDWYGEITDDEQSLRWPRVDVVDRDGREIPDDEIPSQLETATCEQAIYLLGLDPTQPPALTTKGFIRASAGPLSVEADKSMRADMLAPAAIAALAGIGEPRSTALASGSGAGYLIRG